MVRNLLLKPKDEKKNESIILLNFEEIIKNPKDTLKKLCHRLDIEYNENLNIPTFNGEKILSDSSFKSVKGEIDKTTLSRKDDLKENLKNKIDKEILEKCKDLYEKTKKYSI